METPKARRVDPHAYLGPDEPARSVGQRVRSLLGSILPFALGAVALWLNLTLWWALGAFAIALVVVLVLDGHRHQVRRSSSGIQAPLPFAGPSIPQPVDGRQCAINNQHFATANALVGPAQHLAPIKRFGSPMSRPGRATVSLMTAIH